MFNFFRKKAETVQVYDKITMSIPAKLDAMLREAQQSRDTLFIFWFDDSLKEAELYFNNAGLTPSLFLAREIASHHVRDKVIFFAEHFPLVTKEKELYQRLGLTTVTVFTSLSEPMISMVGGEKIIRLLQSLGHKEGEVLEHKMISKSIRAAQQKLEKKIITDLSANSRDEWFKKNLP